MNRYSSPASLALAVVVVLGLVGPVAARDKPVPAAHPHKKAPAPLNVMQPSPEVYVAEPMIEAVLPMGPKQRDLLHQAHEEIYSTAELKQLHHTAADKRLSAKGHKSADMALGLALKAADDKYHKRVDEILTASQKGIIKSVNDAYQEAQQQVPDLLDVAKLMTMTKEERAKLHASFKVAFAAKLQSILTADQKAVLAAAKTK
jgi:hypothetical protein